MEDQAENDLPLKGCSDRVDPWVCEYFSSISGSSCFVPLPRMLILQRLRILMR